MSVLIKMEMPNNCRDCPLEDAYDGYNCRIIPKSANWGLGERPSWCPLVEVPTPHGDLIERDKLREKEFIHDGDAYAVVMSRDIRNAPTIIPADDKDINVPNKEDGER